MFCSKCGFENKDSAQFCKNCGEALNIHANVKKTNFTSKKSNKNSPNNNKIIIIVSVIIISILLVGVLFYMSNSNLSNNNAPIKETENSKNINTTVNDNTEDSTATDNSLKIISGSFSTNSPLPAKTFITVYVGKEHAGEQVKIRVFYTNGDTQLNAGNIVPLTVESSGYFTMNTANELTAYPDHASITLYDGNGNIVDTKEVNMSPTSGTQSF